MTGELQRAAALYNPQLVEMIDPGAQRRARQRRVGAHGLHLGPGSVRLRHRTSKVAWGCALLPPASARTAAATTFWFWDNFHPSERANRIIVTQLMDGAAEYMHPLNLTTILAASAFTQQEENRSITDRQHVVDFAASFVCLPPCLVLHYLAS